MPTIITAGNMSVAISITHENEHPQNNAQHIQEYRYNQAFTEGTIANALDDVYGVEGTAAASPDTIDIVGGITNVYGETMSPGLLKTLIIKNDGTALGEDLTLGNHANHILCEGTIESGGIFVRHYPYGLALSGGSQDTIKLDPGANTIPYEVFLTVST